MSMNQTFATLVFLASMIASGMYFKKKDTHKMTFFLGIAIIALVSSK